jgi:FkbM family methyltransferase
MASKAVRAAVLSHTPSLGHYYRLLRDEIVALTPPVTTPWGFRLCGGRSMSDPAFEKEEIAAFTQYLDRAEVCMDIGANIGLYTCLAASLGKRVIAVEPLPRNLKLLRKNLAANGFTSVEVLPIGLSNENGNKRLFGTGTCASFQEGWAGSPENHFHSVPVRTLDSIVGGLPNRTPLLIKMDVEGFELEVLSGAMVTLNMDPRPTWLIEICLDSQSAAGEKNSKFAETFALFWKFGYQARIPASEHRVVKQDDISRWVAQGHVDFGTHNYIFS